MLLLKGVLFAGLFGLYVGIQWTFQAIEDFSRLSLSGDTSILYTNDRCHLIECCFVCSEIPDCSTVILNMNHCICRSQLTPHSSQIGTNTTIFVKHPVNTCSLSGYIFYNNMCIKVDMEQKNWHEARLDCEIGGGTLVILDSPDKHQAVFDMISLYFPIQEYFIGLSDIVTEDAWEWIRENSSTYMHNNYVLNNRDNQYVGMDADCGTFRMKEDKLVDEYCLQQKAFICEILI